MNESDNLTSKATPPPKALPVSYCGLVDDKVAEFYRDYRSEDLFNRVLAKSLFFGGGLLINDGYLFMNPVARRQMGDEASLLHAMISEGFVRIFTRCLTPDELASLPETSKVDAHIQFASTDDWKYSFKSIWQETCYAAWTSGNVQQWPPARNHKLQSKFYLRILGKDPAGLGLSVDKKILVRIQEILYGQFRREDFGSNPNASAARTKFENACRVALQEAGLSPNAEMYEMRSLMGIANEAYHYSFGAALRHHSGRPVAVDTTISPAFDDLLERENIDYLKFKSIPSIGIPMGVDLSQGEKLIDLMIPGTDAYDAKVNFIGLFMESLFIESQTTDTWESLVLGYGEQYARKLGETLNQSLDKLLAEDTLSQLALARSLTGGFDAAATPLPSLSVAYTTEGGELVGSRIAQFTARDDEKGQPWEFTGKEIVPQVTSLALRPEFVEQFLDDDFLFNDEPFRDDTV